ncbi:cytochrome c1 [Reyranella sp.]|uniref:cytochrome c1 n=1 Tax=Reyranella sp. TaxID=1929291 RepID=UPI001221FB7B|nr:cytochrome c1 [Reyranella sp.]TAJ85916.1 MAG: cytochrome c1 [Reyranella sp.]
MRKLLATGAIALAALATGAVAIAAGTTEQPPQKKWHFQGPFGTFDRAAAQRGYQVYQEVCAACHSLQLLAYRNLMELGLTENQVKDLIKDITVPDLNDDGQPIDRPARPSDRFKKPFPNQAAAAAANNGKAPPDLSVIVKARADGPNYLHGLLTGYVPYDKLTPEQIKEFAVTKDDNFNKYFPGHKIAMAAPLADDKVTYADGTKATTDQEASDVVEFLAWASEPHMEDRKRTGVRVILFLLALAGFMYAVKRMVWSDKH